MSSSPVRFLFDLDFGAAAQPKAASSIVSLEDHEAALKEAEASGYRRGEADGRRAAREADAARLTSAVETLGARLAATLADAEARAEASEREAIALAFALARRLAGAAMARHPMAEISAAAEACFAELRSAPHVAVRVAPDFVEAVRAELQAAAQERGFTGRLIVLGDPEVPEGDARLEWADGGVVRDSAAVARAVEAAVARHLGSHTPTDEQGETP
jgi:flagellar assembly protein FliH